METRTVLWILTFFGFWVNYMLRNNINIAIVAMVKDKISNETMVNECASVANNTFFESLTAASSKHSAQEVTFDWDEYQQGLVLSSYFWIHWLTEIPGGILSHHFGFKKVVGVSNFLTAVGTFLIPFSAKYSFNVLMALRIFQGFVSGTIWPSFHAMTAKWIPQKERGSFVSSYLGSSVGIAFTYAVSGYIIDAYGWEYVFYMQGLLGILWSIAWMLLVYDSPSVHPWISTKEKVFILNSLGDTLHEEGKLPIPWKNILTSRPVWINHIAQFGTTWGLFALITESPSYLKFIHGLDIKSTGIFSGIPHLTRWIFAYIFGIVTQHQKAVSIGRIRMLATTLCTIGVGMTILIISFSGCNVMVAVIMLIVAVTLQGTIPAGPMAKVIDMSPNFSGVVQGISGTLSVLSGFIGPILVGNLTQNNQTSVQWQKFFIITAVICSSTGALDLIFGTSKLQPWNSVKPELSKEQQSTQAKLLSRKSRRK
ncbi:sialin-like [Planococcus citri]|uniref:sialin-like n=1 Tax=Planococcus citri TaxID=170843 RepID=UPI0031F7A91B